jgi:hypothetical protein
MWGGLMRDRWDRLLCQMLTSLLNTLQEALLVADIVELAPRLVICGFPGGGGAGSAAPPDRSLRALESPAKLREWLDKHFPQSHFVVWNLSGQTYDYETALGGKVVVYSFPAHPVPPLAALVEIATSVRDWVCSGGTNVAVLHDLSGRRSAVVGACALQLTTTTNHARRTLAEILLPLGHVGRALVPTQRRFYEYFVKSLDNGGGVKHIPSPKLVLARVIVNGIPDFYSSNGGENALRPVLKVLSASNEVVGETRSGEVHKDDLSFNLTPVTADDKGGYRPTSVQGDVLLRMYHHQKEEMVTICAIGFHTGFVDDTLSLRFLASEVDGAVGNARFPAEFFVDVFFAKAEEGSNVASKTPPLREGDSVGDTLEEIDKLLGSENDDLDGVIDDDDDDDDE